MMTVRYVCNMGKCIIESLLSFTYFLNVIGEIEGVFLIELCCFCCFFSFRYILPNIIVIRQGSVWKFLKTSE